MNTLYIVGAGGFGRELESWLTDDELERNNWVLAGFLDDNPDALKGYPHKKPLCGAISEHVFHDNERVLVAIANSAIKEKIYKQFASMGLIATYIHQSTIIGNYTEIKTGTIVFPRCIISTNVIIGEMATINCTTSIGHDCNLGRFCSLMSNVDLGGGVSLGDHVFMGTKSMVVPRKTIASNVKISAGSVVIRNHKHAGATLFGNPAVEL